jgi:hypothetical protein
MKWKDHAGHTKSDQEPGISDSSELHQTSLIRFMDAVIQERC